MFVAREERLYNLLQLRLAGKAVVPSGRLHHKLMLPTQNRMGRNFAIAILKTLHKPDTLRAWCNFSSGGVNKFFSE